MIALKSCPRCRGDLSLDLDNELACIQCGYETRPEERSQLIARLRTPKRLEPAVAAR